MTEEEMRKLSTKARFRWRKWVAQRYTCPICRKRIKQEHLFDNDRTNIDHIIPRSAGGHGFAENLAVTHRLCNNLRGNRCGCQYEGYGAAYCHPNAIHDYDSRRRRRSDTE